MLSEKRKLEYESIEKEIKVLEQKKNEFLNNTLDELGLKEGVKFKFENDKNIYMVVEWKSYEGKVKRGFYLLKKDGTRNFTQRYREFTFYLINTIAEIL